MTEPTDDEIKDLYAEQTGFILDDSPAALLDFARAIEAEVRKQDDALILQLVEALEKSQEYTEACANGKRVQWWGAQLDRAQDAINAGRARLEQPCA